MLEKTAVLGPMGKLNNCWGIAGGSRSLEPGYLRGFTRCKALRISRLLWCLQMSNPVPRRAEGVHEGLLYHTCVSIEVLGIDLI